ncbi:MAG: LamG-like jellyroll fold domain-containing protein, partial [Verrucomicrobiales bacterium]
MSETGACRKPGSGGGLNNLRLWSRALSEAEIDEAAATSIYGGGDPDLALEFPFDSPSLTTQVSTEGDEWEGDLLNFGTWKENYVASIQSTDGYLQLDQPQSLEVPHTIEMWVRFPLPATENGERTLVSTSTGEGMGSPIVVSEEGELGSAGGSLGVGIFDGSGYSVNGLLGWHIIAAVQTNSGVSFWVDGLPKGMSTKYKPLKPLEYFGNVPSGGQQIGLVDNIQVWNNARRQSELEAAVFSDSDPALLGDSREGLVVLINFNDGTAGPSDGLSTVGGKLIGSAEVIPFAFGNGDGVEYGGADGGTQEEKEAALFPQFRSVSLTSDDAVDGTIHTDDIAIQDWVRVIWNWKKTLQLRVTAQPPEFQDLVYLDVDGELITGDAVSEIWVPAGKDVTVGTRFRSEDRCTTLNSIGGQTLRFAQINLDTIDDGSVDFGNGKVATRQKAFKALELPGSINFGFADTVYRAVLPLGEGLDLSSLANLNEQIVPDLCLGGAIDTPFDGPQLLAASPTQGAVGAPTEWDFINRRFFPVQTGVFNDLWPDIDPTKGGHSVTIFSGFPTESISTDGWYVEDDEGYRLDRDGSRIFESGNDPTTEVLLGAVSDAFPASPTGHYTYLAGVNTGADTDQTIPADLDGDQEDRWFFERASYLSGGSSVDDALKRFTANEEGRSVLVYRYRPSPNDVATGDPRREGVAVRIVDAIALEDNIEPGDELAKAKGNYKEVYLSSSIGQFISPASYGSNYSFGNDAGRSWDFWARADETVADPSKDRVIFEIDAQMTDMFLQFGLRGSTALVNPGGYFMTVKNRTTLEEDTTFGPLELIDVSVDGAWHHWAIVSDASATDKVKIFLDGNLVLASQNPFPDGAQTDLNVHSYGYSMKQTDLWFEGSIDNWRNWTIAIDAETIRSAMRNLSYFESDQPVFAAGFDTDPVGATIPKEDFGSAVGDPVVLKT